MLRLGFRGLRFDDVDVLGKEHWVATCTAGYLDRASRSHHADIAGSTNEPRLLIPCAVALGLVKGLFIVGGTIPVTKRGLPILVWLKVDRLEIVARMMVITRPIPETIWATLAGRSLYFSRTGDYP
jgi:hypothetical protein